MTYAEVVIFEMLPKVGLYSIKYEGHEMNEAEKFFERFGSDRSRQDQINAFLKTLERMGRRGANDYYFDRPEGFIHALPSKKDTKLDLPKVIREYDFDLRLFWSKLSPSVVVLFNGGIKNSEYLQDSPDLHPEPYNSAVKAAKALYEATKYNGEFYIDGRTIVSKGNDSIEISFQ
jgi:hypothetical protein